jgi:cell division FtsZ-interacting protein ZapD
VGYSGITWIVQSKNRGRIIETEIEVELEQFKEFLRQLDVLERVTIKVWIVKEVDGQVRDRQQHHAVEVDWLNDIKIEVEQCESNIIE